jgi:Zn-dependent protease
MFTIAEVIDIVIMSLALGFIFKDVFQIKPSSGYDPIAYFKQSSNQRNFWFAVAVTAPAVILHEFGHKFVAMGFGATATFEAAYMFLGLGVLLKLMNFPFIFFVPAYVAWRGTVTAFQASFIAFAGPLVNLILWLGALAYLTYGKPKHVQFWSLTSKINMFLFIFNLIPIPGFDGSHVVMNLLRGFGLF